MEKNCCNCNFGGFHKCLRGENGELLRDRDVSQESGYDEYDYCTDWARPEVKPVRRRKD